MAINVPPRGDAQRRTLTHWANLEVKAQDSPDLTVQIAAGAYWLNDVDYIEFAGGSSPAMTAPGSSAKWVLIVLNSFGNLALVDGSIAATPSLPTPGSGQIVLAGVLLNVGDTEITNDMVFDLRSTVRLGGQLVAASVGSVPGLSSALDDKASVTSVTNGLAGKADTSGTPDTVFTLNANHTGAALSNNRLEIERGAETNVWIRWNEASNLWQFTNDGTVVNDLLINSSGTNAAILANASSIVVLQASVVVADTGIAANASAIVVLQASIAAVDNNASAIALLQASATAHHTSIGVNASDIALLQASIAAVDNNASTIVVLQASVTANETAIGTNLTSIGVNASDITLLQASVTAADGVGSANSVAIAVNASDIALLQASVTAADSAIVVNSSAIADNASAIGTNTSDLATASANIVANNARIGTASGITTVNASAIADNASAIGTNATGIADNASAISVLEAATHPYDLHGFHKGTLTAATDIWAWKSPRAFTIPTQSVLLQALIGAGGDNTIIDILHDGGGGASAVGSGGFASAISVGTVLIAVPIAVGIGDLFVVTVGASADATIADIAFAINGEE